MAIVDSASAPSLLSNGLNSSNGGMTCSLFDGDQHKCDVIVGVRKAMASLSLIGCIFMITIIWLFRKYHIFPQRLILYLTCAALFESISYFFTPHSETSGTCIYQAWSFTFCSWSVFLWVCSITCNLYLNVVHMLRSDQYEWAYHIVCWGIPLLMSVLPFIGNQYGNAGMWCWIKGDSWGWRFGIWYIPLFIGIAVLFVAYSFIMWSVNKKVKTWEGMYSPDVERSKQMLARDVKPLRAYPFVYLACSIFPLINRIQNAIHHEPIFVLVLLQTITSPLNGAINAIVFGLDPETMSRLKFSQLRVAILTRFQHSSDIHEYEEQTNGAEGQDGTGGEQASRGADNTPIITDEAVQPQLPATADSQMEPRA